MMNVRSFVDYIVEGLQKKHPALGPDAG